MSSTPDSDDLGRRLRTLVAHHVTDETRARHLAAVDEQLRAAAATDGASQGARPSGRRARRWVAGLAAVTAVLTPSAVAAQNTVPGQALYPLKQATEQVQSWVSPDAAARNRVAELAALLAGDAARDEVLAAARAARTAVASLPADHALQMELAGLLGQLDATVGSTDRVPAAPPNAGTGADTDTGGADEPDDDDLPHLHDDGSADEPQDDAEHGDDEDEVDDDDVADAETDDADIDETGETSESSETPADEDDGGDADDQQDLSDTETEPAEDAESPEADDDEIAGPAKDTANAEDADDAEDDPGSDGEDD